MHFTFDDGLHDLIKVQILQGVERGAEPDLSVDHVPRTQPLQEIAHARLERLLGLEEGVAKVEDGPVGPRLALGVAIAFDVQ